MRTQLRLLSRTLPAALCLLGSIPSAQTCWDERTVHAMVVDTPSEAVFADLDGDGRLDVASADISLDTVAWLRNDTGAGDLWTARIVDLRTDQAESLDVGDIDGDGDLDLAAVARLGDDVTWYENVDGSARRWARHQIDDLANDARHIHLADVDDDGDLDVLATYNPGPGMATTAWYVNELGDGSTWVEITVASLGRWVTTGDVNGDGLLDVIVAEGSTVAWFDVSSLPPVQHTVAPGAFSSVEPVEAADLDGDGDVELVVGDRGADAIYWLEGSAGGTSWTLHTLPAAVPDPRDLSLLDFDTDGDADVLVAGGLGGTVEWYENAAGDASAWTVHPVASGAARSAGAGDMDADGDLDVVFTTYTGDLRVAEDLSGDGLTWSDRDVQITVRDADHLVALDVDGDGDTDLAASGGEVPKVVWFENRNGRCGSWLTHVADTPGSADLAAADVDGDGDDDLVGIRTDEIFWLANAAGGASWSATTIATGDAPWALTVADLDGDGDTDVAWVSNSLGQVGWQENTSGDGSAWARHLLSNTLAGAYDVAADDVDGDGDADLLACGALGSELRWYENLTGDGSAWSETTIASGAFATRMQLAPADVDGDGDRDVLDANQSVLRWHENTAGDGSSWTTRTIGTAGTAPLLLATADVDGDGAQDVLAAGTSNQPVRWYRNASGDGTSWSAGETIVDYSGTAAGFEGNRSLIALDVDLDGDPDPVLGLRVGVFWFTNGRIHQFSYAGSSGLNTKTLVETAPAQQGGGWSVTTSAVGHGASGAFVVLVSHSGFLAGGPSILGGTGELLVGLPPLGTVVGSHDGVTATAAASLPDNPALCGFVFYEQGFVLGGGFIEATTALCSTVRQP